jgi:RimJ/RimL family protein N-acetyltransferase
MVILIPVPFTCGAHSFPARQASDNGVAAQGHGMTTVLRETPQVASQVELRWLTADDWQDLRRMRLAALKDSPRSFLSRYEDELLFTEEQWRTQFRRGNWILAYKFGEPIGMVGVTEYSDIPAGDRYLEYLWIAPAMRRTGAGSAFVSMVIDELASARVGSVWLWILDGNHTAGNLYKKLGFTVQGDPVDLVNHPGRWETRMTLNLSCPLSQTPAGAY